MPVTVMFCMDSCICGYHAFKEVWTATFGEQVYTEREYGNVVDRYAVAMKKATKGITFDTVEDKI